MPKTINDSILSLIPMPTVDLDMISAPKDGSSICTSNFCIKKFEKDDSCKKHYESLLKTPREVIQCPYGLSSYAVISKAKKFALTGVIPNPRLGGKHERNIAKQHPELKVDASLFNKSAELFNEFHHHLEELEQKSINNHSMALHEIRKLNRTVKQSAERLCLQENPEDPDKATPKLVNIWKSADLMSLQFDVIELLANEKLTDLPLISQIEVHRIFDKCVRIYRHQYTDRTIKLTSHFNYHPKINACDKTFPIIPTVLIENAIRYSPPDTTIEIDIARAGKNCVVTVNNITNRNDRLDSSIFERGIRANSDKEGSGNGLYLVKLISDQHGAKLRLETSHKSGTTMMCTIVVTIPESNA